MKPIQKILLSILLLCSLAAISAVGVSVFPLAGAIAPQRDSPLRAAATFEPTATTALALMPASSITQTPFQPVQNTPTHTPSPLPTATPTPTHTPSPTQTPTQAFPDTALIEGIWGYQQAFNLSCESRSASDLARYFGVTFSELEFLYALPTSDNPERGFVGDVRGSLGQLPPLGYGVHAGPVADLMREFGLNAKARWGMDLEDIKIELAARRPVMIWAISDMGYSSPVEYTDSNGETATVARYEHTFIVIGYGPGSVTVLDNEKIYSVTEERFLRSWGVLGNMGIVIRP